MSVVAFDVAAVRARFSALDRPTAFFDAREAPRRPDSVIEAMAGYLRESNANLGGPFETSRRSDALVVSAHHTAARFLGCDPDEVGFGQNMTTLNFALTRTLGRELRAGDEIVVTRLDHDGNVSPWLQLADDLDLVGPLRRPARGGRHARHGRPGAPAGRADARGRLPAGLERGRDGHRRPPDRRARARRRRARLGRRRPLRAALPHRRARARRGRAPLLAVQVLRAASRPLLRPARAARELAAVQGAPGARRARRAPASRRARSRTRRSPASTPRSPTSSRSAGRGSQRTSASSGSDCSPGCRTRSASTARRPWRGGWPPSPSRCPA